MTPERVAIGLGANLGARRATLRSALRELRALDGLLVLAVSRFHETAPAGGPPGQRPYLNAALFGECSLEPLDLLEALQRIEAAHGRDRAREERFGPRTLDLDLLLHGDRVVSGPRLELPHPRMLERRFVLAPLAEIAPRLEVPGTSLTVAGALARLDAESRSR